MKERERNSLGEQYVVGVDCVSPLVVFHRRRDLFLGVGYRVSGHALWLWDSVPSGVPMAVGFESAQFSGSRDHRLPGNGAIFHLSGGGCGRFGLQCHLRSQRHETSGSVHETQNRPLERGKPPSGRETRLLEEREKEEKKKYGRLHAREQRRGWYLHLLLFLIAHFVFATLFGWKTASGIGGWVETWIDTWNAPELFPFRKEEVNQISRIWTLILLIDGINSFYYTIFPKQKKHMN